MAGQLSAGVMKSYQRKREEPLGQSSSSAEPSIHGNNSSMVIVIAEGGGTVLTLVKVHVYTQKVITFVCISMRTINSRKDQPDDELIKQKRKTGIK